jgi:GT2 family glycosyltransferase
MQKMDCFCFVVLHYQTRNDTIECVQSILSNIKYPNYYIIIVDNGSTNNSGAVLAGLYQDNLKIKVIINKKNLGFTGGNNIGFHYAKQVFGANYIALINNDTIIEQQNFIEKVMDKNRKKPFHILGPDIISMSGKHQSPVFNKLSSLQAVKNYLNHYRKILVLNYLALDKLLEKIKKSFVPQSKIHFGKVNVPQDHFTEQRGVTLHGSAMIFSRAFIDNYNGLLEGPFMYGEEAILDFIAKRDNLTTIYCPDIKIIHKDDSSTNYMFRNTLMKRRFYLKNLIRSLIILQELMNQKHADVSK